MKVTVEIQLNHIITKAITIQMTQKNSKEEKKENMKLARRIMNNEEGKGDGKSEKA